MSDWKVDPEDFLKGPPSASPSSAPSTFGTFGQQLVDAARSAAQWIGRQVPASSLQIRLPARAADWMGGFGQTIRQAWSSLPLVPQAIGEARTTLPATLRQAQQSLQNNR